MKKLLIVSLLVISSTVAFGGYYMKGQKPAGEKSERVIVINFVNPLNFDGSDKQKNEVIEYIKYSVNKTMKMSGMNNISIQKDMERAELDAFKRLTKVQNKTLLENCISQVQAAGISLYTLIEDMYKMEKEAASQELTW